MKNTKLSLADLGETKIGQWATLAIFGQKVLISLDGDEIKGARQLWDAARQREDWGIEMSQFFLRELKKGMAFSNRSSAPMRVEDGGHSPAAEKAIKDMPPSSPQSTWSKADVRPEIKTNHETAGQGARANKGQNTIAQPSREPVDGGRGQWVSANTGHKGPAPSPSSAMLGHNSRRFKPGNARRGLASIAAVQPAMAKTLETYTVLDGRILADMTFRDVRRYRAASAQDATLMQKILNHGANIEDHEKVRDVVSSEHFSRLLAEAEEVSRAA